MKLISLLILLLSQGDVLIEQHGAKVQVADVDSYIHDLPDDVRTSISYDNFQLEKDILGMLNMNIVYHYLNDSGLIDKPHFQQIIQETDNTSLEIDESFIDRLDVKADKFEKTYTHYNVKKALYAGLNDYIRQEIDVSKAEKLAYDRYKAAHSDYIKPEQRDISMIALSQDDYNQEEVLNIVKQLLSNDSSTHFSEMAVSLSDDKTVAMNQGQLGFFKKAGFRYPFAEDVFIAKMGLVPAVFEKDGTWYIVRVNDIVPAEKRPFDEVKEAMTEKIITQSIKRRFQSIISEYAQHQVEVNKELVQHIFTRYEVFQ